jgi:hypothetical protein
LRFRAETSDMTRLLVVPVAALTLATATPSASAHVRRPVVFPWADPPAALNLTAEHADLPGPHAALIQPAKSLPLAVLATPGEAVNPDGRSAVAAPPAAASVAGRPLTFNARGPP